MGTANKRSDKKSELILLLLIFSGVAAFLLYLIFQAPPPPEPVVLPPAAVSPEPTAPAPAPTPDPNVPAPPAAVGANGTGEVSPPVQPPTMVTGRCADQALKATLQTIVNDCAGACGVGKEKDPLITLTQTQFNDLFASGDDDAGFASYFAIFGCNVYGPEDCHGYDAYYTNQKACPTEDQYEWVTREEDTPNGKRRVHPMSEANGAQANCQAYATSIENGFNNFINKHLDADHYIFIGTASASGNAGGIMNPLNRRLAGQRAGNLRDELVKRQLATPDKFTGRGASYVVVLDNTKHRFDDPRFKQVLTRQVNKDPTPRTFQWDSSNAVNRSVMVLAIKCPGL